MSYLRRVLSFFIAIYLLIIVYKLLPIESENIVIGPNSGWSDVVPINDIIELFISWYSVTTNYVNKFPYLFLSFCIMLLIACIIFISPLEFYWGNNEPGDRKNQRRR